MIKAVVVASVGYVLVLAAPPRAVADSRVIDFESFPDPNVGPIQYGIPLRAQYGSWGVLFNYAQPHVPSIQSFPNSPHPHSASFVAEGPDFGTEFNDQDFKIDFRTPQTLVQLYGGTKCPAATGTLRAVDIVGNILVDSKALTALQTSTKFEIRSDAGILEVSFQAVQAGAAQCDESVDDLYFEGPPPPAPPGTPPSIVLTAPGPLNDYRNQYLDVAATISGSQLDHLDIELTNLDAEQASTSQFTFYLGPNQRDGTNIPFAHSILPPGLAFGHYRIVATLHNIIDQTDQASLDFANFPAGLGTTGTTGTLGPFRFSVVEENCQMLFWENGAEAYFPLGSSPATIAVPIAIAEKWSRVNSPMLGPKRSLGCPLVGGPENTVGAWVTQNFERGRIYLPPGGAPAVYVPGILTRALAALAPGYLFPYNTGPEFTKVGWPVADPDYDLLVDDPTWVFQQFAQNAGGIGYRNTLEIRGREPKLYVERVGGDVDELVAAGLRADTAPVIDNRTPTLWETFSCSKQVTDVWPTDCDLSSISANPQTAGETLFNSAFVCSYTTYPSVDNWVGWDNENFDPKYYAGLIKAKDPENLTGSHLATEDNVYAHSTCVNMGAGDWLDAIISWVNAGITFLTIANTNIPNECTWGTVAEWLNHGTIGDTCKAVFAEAPGGAGWLGPLGLRNGPDKGWCRSDWDLHTRPLRDASDWSFLSTNNVLTQNFEIEFEYAWAQRFYQRFEPVPGDLVVAHGRPIIDCGHGNYNSEIHPPDTLAVSRSFVWQPIANLDPMRTTDAYVWVNGFLPSTTPISIPIYAPPRPSAGAHLCVRHSEGSYSRLENMTATTLPNSTGVTLEFTTPNNFPRVGDGALNGGQYMYPESGEPEYQDNIWLYWADSGEPCGLRIGQ